MRDPKNTLSLAQLVSEFFVMPGNKGCLGHYELSPPIMASALWRSVFSLGCCGAGG